jgi:hypothetical protein
VIDRFVNEVELAIAVAVRRGGYYRAGKMISVTIGKGWDPKRTIDRKTNKKKPRPDE